MQLRPYQEQAINKIREAYAGGINKQVAVLATGLGKTVIFSHIISSLVQRTGKKALILAHREELLSQAKDKLEKVNSQLKVDIEKADDWAEDHANVVVASVPTIGRTGSERIKRFKPEDFGIVVIDEAHHASADTYRNVLRHFGLLKGEDEWNIKTLLLGVTATPSRNDNKGIDKIFDKVVYEYPIVPAIKDNWLSRIKAWRINTDTDLRGVKKTAGDFNVGELAEAVNTEGRNGLIIKAYLQLAKGTQALCFAVDVAHAMELSKDFNEAGVPTDFVVGSSTNRADVLERFSKRELNVVVNCMVLTEGFDEPSIETILMARPTQSGILFQQMVGRGTRLFQGKEYLTVIDFVDNTYTQSLQTTASLLGMKGALDFKGRDILEVHESVEKLLELAPNADLSKVDIDKIQYAIEEVDLMSGLKVPDEIAPFTQLDWYRFDEDTYRIGLANNQSMILSKNLTGQYVLVEHEYDKLTRQTKETTIGQWSELETAIKNADDFISQVHQDVLILVKSNARWRKQPMSSGQFGLLEKFRINQAVIEQLDKGQASRLISRLIDTKKRWRKKT